jgi:hypothetical protein
MVLATHNSSGMKIRDVIVRNCVLIAIAVPALAAQDKRVVVRLRDPGAALINPGMGWMFHHYDNDIRRYTVDLDPSDGVDEFPGVSSVYIRLAWSYIEPEEHKFNWAIVDTAPAACARSRRSTASRCARSHRLPSNGSARRADAGRGCARRGRSTRAVCVYVGDDALQ